MNGEIVDRCKDLSLDVNALPALIVFTNSTVVVCNIQLQVLLAARVTEAAIHVICRPSMGNLQLVTLATFGLESVIVDTMNLLDHLDLLLLALMQLFKVGEAIV